jgi:hypothetical protein
MLGLRLVDLAADADVNLNTIRYWEARETIDRRGHEPWALKAVREALARRGIEIFSDPTPGVRFASGRGH